MGAGWLTAALSGGSSTFLGELEHALMKAVSVTIAAMFSREVFFIAGKPVFSEGTPLSARAPEAWTRKLLRIFNEVQRTFVLLSGWHSAMPHLPDQR